MAIDEFQRRVLQAIAANRSPDSHVGGGAALQARGSRLSSDIDLFHKPDADVERYAQADIETLQKAGFHVQVTKVFPSFIEATVGHEKMGRTRLQWTIDSEYRFLTPVRDDTFGWRLQMPDLAVNKVIAAATRGEPRDFVDLVYLDRFYMPLWYVAWAAPGKDDSFGPDAILTQVERFSFARAHEISDVLGIEEFDPKAIRRSLVKAIGVARKLYQKLPPEDVGHLYSENSKPVLRPDSYSAVRRQYERIGITKGGAWPIIPELLSDEIRFLKPGKGGPERE